MNNRVVHLISLGLILFSSFNLRADENYQFKFTVPLDMTLVCEDSINVYAVCIVGTGDFDWPAVSKSENGTSLLVRDENGGNNDVIGGNSPAVAGGGSVVKYQFNGGNEYINEDLIVQFNALPGKSPHDATGYKCYTVFEISGVSPDKKYIVPGSVDSLANPENPSSGVDCAYNQSSWPRTYQEGQFFN